MAGSSRLHDSRLSLVRVLIPLPAVRPRQWSWGTSLPQSVILFCLLPAPLAIYLQFDKTQACPRHHVTRMAPLVRWTPWQKLSVVPAVPDRDALQGFDSSKGHTGLPSEPDYVGPGPALVYDIVALRFQPALADINPAAVRACSTAEPLAHSDLSRLPPFSPH